MSLAKLQWQHRIIVIQENNEKRVEKFRSVLEKNPSGLQDRDIVWYLLHETTLIHNHKRYDYAPPTHEFKQALLALLLENRPYQILLLGKDGGVKMREKNLDINAIFNTIDAMPMRIREMEKSP